MSNQHLTPDPAQAPKPRWWHTRRGHYFIGIALGTLPLILTIVALSNNSENWVLNFLLVAGVFYCIACIAAIVCLAIERVRFVGYGLLTMVLSTPIVAFIGCIVIITMPNG